MMSEWTGKSGTHWGLIGEQFALLIERSVAPETLHVLASRRSVEEIIDALVARGIDQLPGFCLVGFNDSRVTAYLRGDFALRVEASWHDAMTETGEHARTWREVSVEGVSRFAILGPDQHHLLEVPTRNYESDRERIVLGVQGLSLAICERLTVTEIPLMTTTTSAGVVRSIHEKTPEIKPVTVDPNIFDELFGEVTHEPVDDATVLSVPDELFDEAPESESLEVPSQSGPGYVLVLPDGDEIAVYAEALLGRNPRDEDGTGAELVAVFDPNGNISRTHARIIITDEGVMVQDNGSTNGTVLVTESDEIALEAHVPRRMRSGDLLILGGDAQLELREL